MTLLSVVKEVMDSNGWPAPVVGVAGSQDQNMRQSFALANKVLLSTSFKKNWPILVREQPFTTVPGQSDYDLPNDFHHLVASTAWRKSDYYRMKGSMTPYMFNRALTSGQYVWPVPTFRINVFTKKFTIIPTPTAADELIYAYVTNLIVRDADGNYKTKYALDTDIALVDEEIIEIGLSWRWRQKKGLDYTAEIAEYNAAMRDRFAQHLGADEVNVGGKPPYDPPLTDGYIGPGPIGV